MKVLLDRIFKLFFLYVSKKEMWDIYQWDNDPFFNNSKLRPVAVSIKCSTTDSCQYHTNAHNFNVFKPIEEFNSKFSKTIMEFKYFDFCHVFFWIHCITLLVFEELEYYSQVCILSKRSIWFYLYFTCIVGYRISIIHVDSVSPAIPI